MSDNKLEQHQEMIDAFIELANKFKDQGKELPVISTALMSATSIYTTYVYAGNQGYLQEGGEKKVVDAFAKNLHRLQAFKQTQAKGTQAS